MSSQVCIDASLALKLVLAEADSAIADALWHRWITTHTEIIAPPLFPIEATAVLRLQVHKGNVSITDGAAALQTILALKIRVRSFPLIHQHAWQLATTLNQPRAYDTHYLALALYQKCTFWTADERLYNAATTLYPQIHWLGNGI